MTTPDPQPNVDAFLALARSSPWRWRTLHFRHRSGHRPAVVQDEVEVWLTRPDGVRLRDADGRSLPPGVETQRRDGQPTRTWDPPTPTFRSDGLVDRRPWDFDDDGLFWRDYHWVAMLDPVELSHHVDVTNLREDVVAGRRAWRADLRALPGYQPRCGGNCCELLYSEAGLKADFWDDLSRIPEEWQGRQYPDFHDVALDVATGVVVLLCPVGGSDAAPWLENEILDVG